MTRFHADRALSCLLVAALAGAGCATTSAFRNGERAEQLQDYDLAVVEYTKEVQKKPDNRDARRALERAKLRAAQDHFTRGRRLLNASKIDEALVELQIAGELNPGNKEIEDAVRATRTELRTKLAVTREGKTRLESLIERTRTLAPQGFELPDAKLPGSLTLRSIPMRDAYTTIARMTDMNVVFDPDLRDQPVTIDLRNSTLEDALNSVASSTRTFYRVTGQRTIAVIPDTPAKRRDYEEEIVRTFYLSNADLKETVDLLRIVIDARRIAPIAATNAITIKDTPERVAAASRVISAIDKARPEVIIDVELLEVDRTRLKEYGLQLASPGSPGIDGQVDINQEGGLTLRDLRMLSQSDVFFTQLPGLFYRLLKRDQNTRALANPQLRTMEGVSAQAKFGERVPVPVSTFTPLAQGGVNTQPITSYNYENIGVNIDIKPRTHHDDEVSLELKISVSSVSGTGFGGLPTFGNREINTVIRLRDGETNILAGLIRDDERRTLEGVPGLSDLPIVGRLFAHNKKETQETDIVLTLTPRIIRVLDLTEGDLRPFRVGREAAISGSIIDLPIQPMPLPPAPTPPAPNTLPPLPPADQPRQPQQQPGTAQPIQPVPPPQTR